MKRTWSRKWRQHLERPWDAGTEHGVLGWCCSEVGGSAAPSFLTNTSATECTEIRLSQSCIFIPNELWAPCKLHLTSLHFLWTRFDPECTALTPLTVSSWLPSHPVNMLTITLCSDPILWFYYYYTFVPIIFANRLSTDLHFNNSSFLFQLLKTNHLHTAVFQSCITAYIQLVSINRFIWLVNVSN